MNSFTVEKRDHVAIIRLDAPNDKVNKLHPELIQHLTKTLTEFRTNDAVQGILITSAKPSNFIAGVDIELFQNYSYAEEFEQLSLQGHDILNEIERFPKPIVACIHGSCMGGGTELALACHYRVVTQDPATRIALPEVKIGLLPGMGGTQRLPRRIGIHAALPYLLTGKNMYASQARSTGFADAVVMPEYMESAALQLILNGPNKRTRKHLKKVARKAALFNSTPLRNIVLAMAKKGVLKHTYGNYPAPLHILECVEIGLKKGLAEGITNEAREFGKLAVTPESAALIRLFFLMNAAKKNPYAEEAASTALECDTIHSIGIVGSGLMGGGIADVSAQNGYEVTLFDQNREQAQHVLVSIARSLTKKRKQKQISHLQKEAILSSLNIAETLSELSQSDVVIEAIVEKLEVKQSLFKELESHVKPETVLASNTSSLPIAEIFKECERPEQGIGMHYFSPVQKMPLLELIYTSKTSKETLQKAYDVGLHQGKTVIAVKDGPGFYTTRILAPFMNEALLLFEEGGNPETIDRIMKKAGFPVGPYALLDEVGLDVAAHVGKTLKEMFEERGGVTSELAQKLFEEGVLGRKSGAGFYSYSKKKKVPNQELKRFRMKKAQHQSKVSFSDEDVRDRLLFMMINEAVHTLQEGILGSAEDGDLGAIMGLGYPPFLGGPFLTIDKMGASTIIKRMQGLQGKYGERFRPAPLLLDYANEKRCFTEFGKLYL